MAKLKRLIDLEHRQMRTIRARQNAGTMTKHLDKYGYLCFDEDELKTYKPRKSGRKPKITNNQSK
jgi:hypothetical protein